MSHRLFSIYNARILFLKQISDDMLEIEYEKNLADDNLYTDKIIKLKFKKIILEVGSTIQIFSEVFNIDKIIRIPNLNSKIGCKIITSGINRTTQFLLPSLNIKKSALSYGKGGSFINAFLNKKNDMEIHILFRVSTMFKDNIFLLRLLEECHSYIDNYYINKEHVIYVFKIDDEYINDIKLLKESKYSKLSSNLKSKILSFHNIEHSDELYGILYKTELYRKELEKKLITDIPVGCELGEVINDNEYIEEYIDKHKELTSMLF